MKKKTAAAFWIVIGVMLALSIGGVSRAELPALPPMPDTTPAGKPHFDTKGAQVGEQIPDLVLKEPDGTARSLHGQLHGPTLILTSSFTCPKSRSMFAKAAALVAGRKSNEINLLVIYVLEAHPKGDVCPYSDVEDVTIENQRDHVLERQPRTMEARLALAEKFRQRLNVEAPILVDEMDNLAWKSLGGGPNMGVLVDSSGIVLARQGWFDDVSMGAAMKALGERRVGEKGRKRREGFNYEDTLAARDGDLEALKAQLTKSPEMATKILGVESRGSSGGRTLLHYAVESEHLSVVELLVEKGADVNLEAPFAPSPLHVAAKNNDAPAITLFLIAHGAKVNAKSRGYGPTPLQEALINAKPAVVEALIKAGATGNFFTDVATGKLQDVRAKIDADDSIAIRTDGDGRPPLAYAAACGQMKMVEVLLAAGAHDSSPTPYMGDREESAIWWAVQNKNVPMIHFLCTHGSDPNLLGDAMFRKSPEAVRELLACKADPKKADINGYFPVHLAAIHDQPEIMTMLLDAGADPSTPTGPDYAPCGPSSSDGESDKRVPLHMTQSAEVIKTLIKRGAKVDARDRNGRTALHCVAGSYEEPAKVVGAVKELLASGADVNAKTGSGETALDLAERAIESVPKPDKCVVEALLARGAKHGDPPATQPAGE